MKKFIAGLLVTAMTAALLTGCGKDVAGAKRDGETGGYTLNLGASGDAALNNPLVQLADEKGYFAENNLTITQTKLENSGAVMYDALSVQPMRR